MWSAITNTPSPLSGSLIFRLFLFRVQVQGRFIHPIVGNAKQPATKLVAVAVKTGVIGEDILQVQIAEKKDPSHLDGTCEQSEYFVGGQKKTSSQLKKLEWVEYNQERGWNYFIDNFYFPQTGVFLVVKGFWNP